MPVILGDKDSVGTWLDDPSTSRLQPLLSRYENSDLVWYPVASAIGKLSFDGPECIQQIPLKASQNSLISKFFSKKQAKTDEGGKETKSTDAHIPFVLKEEPKVEDYEGTVVSDSNKNIQELDEEKVKSNEAKTLGFQKFVKAEPLREEDSAVASHLDFVKIEVEEDTSREDKSIKSGLTKVTDESNASRTAESDNLDVPKILNEDLNQLELPHETVENEIGNENQKTVLTCETKEGGLEFSGKSSGKSGTKRDYELIATQEKPWKHSETLQDVNKSCGKHGRKQGKGKPNIKKS